MKRMNGSNVLRVVFTVMLPSIKLSSHARPYHPRIPSSERQWWCSGAGGPSGAARCAHLLVQRACDVRPHLAQVLFTVLWEERGKARLFQERAGHLFTRDGDRLPLVNVVRVPCCRSEGNEKSRVWVRAHKEKQRARVGRGQGRRGAVRREGYGRWRSVRQPVYAEIGGRSRGHGHTFVLAVLAVLGHRRRRSARLSSRVLWSRDQRARKACQCERARACERDVDARPKQTKSVRM